ncbi:MAG: sigma-70 family RNA polymerase sigma factor [Actinomycetota bacterium]|nr:sigma-70 family RNA polymerase sigma factor [Actinomycetota bacterium]
MSVPEADPQQQIIIRTLPEEALLELYASQPTPALEEELVNRFMPLARSLAMRYKGSLEASDDLIQVASLALVKALRGYDPERGRRFAAYAAPTILGELKRHFRDHTWRLHMPRRAQENTMHVERVTSSLADDLGRTPTAREVAEWAGIPEEDVLDAFQARESQRSVSLDLPVRRDEPDAIPMVDTIGREELGYQRVEAQISIESCAQLEDRERQVLEMRFVEDLNQYEICERIGISQMQVSRLMRRALAKLLEAVQGDEAPEGRRTFAEDRYDPRLPNGRQRKRPAQEREAQTAA